MADEKGQNKKLEEDLSLSENSIPPNPMVFLMFYMI
jgi:hypothetical protein